MRADARILAIAAILLGLVALTAGLAAATAGTGAGRSNGAGGAGAGRAPGQAAQLCTVVSQVERLSVTRADAFAQNGFEFAFPRSVTVRSASEARAVAGVICALPRAHAGANFCPADFGIDYRLLFTLETGGSARPVIADATGCRFVTGAAGSGAAGSPAMVASARFWATLGRAMGLARASNRTFAGSHRQAGA